MGTNRCTANVMCVTRDIRSFPHDERIDCFRIHGRDFTVSALVMAAVIGLHPKKF